MEDKFFNVKIKIIEDFYENPLKFFRDFIRVQETYGNKKQIVSSSLNDKEGTLIDKTELCCIANEVPSKNILDDPSIPPVCFVYNSSNVNSVNIVDVREKTYMVRKIPNVKIYNGHIPYIPIDSNKIDTNVVHYGMDPFTTETIISILIDYLEKVDKQNYAQKYYISTICGKTGVFFYMYPIAGSLEDLLKNLSSTWIRYYELPVIDGNGNQIGKSLSKGGYFFPGFIHSIFNDVFSNLNSLEDAYRLIHGDLDISNVFVNRNPTGKIPLRFLISGFKYSSIIIDNIEKDKRIFKIGHIDENFSQPKAYNSKFLNDRIIFSAKDLKLIRNGIYFPYIIDYMIFWVSVLLNTRVFYQVMANKQLHKYYWKNVVYKGEESKLYQRMVNAISKKMRPTSENICNEILNGISIKNNIKEYFISLSKNGQDLEIDDNEYRIKETYLSDTEDQTMDDIEDTEDKTTEKTETIDDQTNEDKTLKKDI